MESRIGRVLCRIALATLLAAPSLSAAERIVSIGPATTELLQALGAGEQIIATDLSSQGLKVPKVGYHRTLAAEGILSLAPSRVIGSDEMGPQATLDQLTRAGVTVNVLPTAPTLDNLYQRIDTLAGVLGRAPEAKALKEKIAAEAEALAARRAGQPARKVAFLLLHKGQPLSLAGGDTTAAALIRLAGGEHLGAALQGYKPIAAESLIKMQPELVLVSGREWQHYQDAATVLAEVPALAATPAGQRGAIHAIDGQALLGGLSLSALTQARHITDWMR